MNFLWPKWIEQQKERNLLKINLINVQLPFYSYIIFSITCCIQNEDLWDRKFTAIIVSFKLIWRQYNRFHLTDPNLSIYLRYPGIHFMAPSSEMNHKISQNVIQFSVLISHACMCTCWKKVNNNFQNEKQHLKIHILMEVLEKIIRLGANSTLLSFTLFKQPSYGKSLSKSS